MKLKFRRGLIQFLALLLVALPALGVFASPSSAATSRVAVIQSLNGTVQVKKSGGSKEFKAFARMSLNEGDVLATSANSSAVLQFANGSSEDDKMTVSANTTLTFSKLSDRNGTRTKVSMFNGNAWVDVKSIATNNDEFTLETPTAIMGVRGTHLMVSVDPLTGETRLSVAAGVVNTKPTGTGESRDVLPGDHALVTKDEEDNGEMYIAPVDLDALMKLSPADLIEAILNAASEVAQENERKMNEYLNQTNAPGSASPADLERIRNNIESLLGAIVKSATDSGKITQDRVRELVSDAEARTGFKVDLSKKEITLSDEQKRKQEALKQQAERNRERAEQQKQLEEQKRKQQEELLKKLEDEKKKKEEELRKALEEKRKQAEAAYEKSLSDAEKQRFQEDRKNREQERTGQTPSSNTSPSDSGSSQPGPVNAFLSYVKVQPVNSQEADTVQMTSGKFQYSLDDVTGSVPGLAFTPIAQSGAIVKQVKVNGETVTGNVQSDLTVVYLISLSEGDNSIETIVQEASNANRTNSYTFNIKWTYVAPSSLLEYLDVKQPVQSTAYAVDQVFEVVMPYEVASVAFRPVPANENTTVVVKDGDVTLPPDSSAYPGYYEVSLAGSNPKRLALEATDHAGATQHYTVKLVRMPELAGLKLNGASIPGAPAEWDDFSYSFAVDANIAYATLEPTVADAGNLSIEINGETVASGSESRPIHLFAGATNSIWISIKDNASDDEVIRQYLINIERGESTEQLDGIYAFDSDGEPVDFPAEGSFSIPYELNRIQLYIDTTWIGTGFSVFVDGSQPEFDLEEGYFDLHLDGTVHHIEIWVDGEVYTSFTIDRSSIVTDPDRNGLLDSMGVYYWLVEGWVDILDNPDMNLEFNPLQTYYELTLPPFLGMDTEEIIISASAFNELAEIKVTNGSDEAVDVANNWVTGYSVPLHGGENNILITVTSGATIQQYRVVIHMPPTDRPYLVTNWSATTSDDQGNEVDVVWKQDEGLPFGFVTRSMESATSLNLTLEFDDTQYYIAAFDFFNEVSEAIGSWPVSGSELSIPLVDEEGGFFLAVYEKNDVGMETPVSGAMLMVLSSKPNLAVTLAADHQEDYRTIHVGNQTLLGAIPSGAAMAYLKVDEEELAYSNFFVGTPSVGGVSLQWDGDWEEYGVQLEDGITEIQLPIIDEFGIVPDRIYTLKLYYGNMESLQLDLNQSGMTLTGSVYGSPPIGYDLDYSEYYTEILYQQPVLAQLNLIGTVADSTVMIYDRYDNSVDPNEVWLDTADSIDGAFWEYFIVIMAEDQRSWRVAPFIIRRTYGI